MMRLDSDLKIFCTSIEILEIISTQTQTQSCRQLKLIIIRSKYSRHTAVTLYLIGSHTMAIEINRLLFNVSISRRLDLEVTSWKE